MRMNKKRHSEFEKVKIDRKILSCLRVINNTVRKTADIYLSGKCNALSEMSARIILYLNQQEEEKKAVPQKDLERAFSISRATVSQIISRMEKNKLVKRIGDTYDSRIKRISMTDYARQMVPYLKSDGHQFESRILKGFSEEEKNNLLGYLERLQNNLHISDN